MTLAINLLPVTRTRTPWRWGAAKDRRKLKGINRRYLRMPKSATAANGVIGTAMKSCIHKHPSPLDQRPLRRLKLNNAVLVWSFGGLRGLWSGYGCSNGYIGGCGRLRLPWPTSAAGERFAARTDLCHQYSLSPVKNFIGSVVDTGKQFIAGVLDTGEQFMTPAITFFPSVVDTSQK